MQKLMQNLAFLLRIYGGMLILTAGWRIIDQFFEGSVSYEVGIAVIAVLLSVLASKGMMEPDQYEWDVPSILRHLCTPSGRFGLYFSGIGVVSALLLAKRMWPSLCDINPVPFGETIDLAFVFQFASMNAIALIGAFFAITLSQYFATAWPELLPGFKSYGSTNTYLGLYSKCLVEFGFHMPAGVGVLVAFGLLSNPQDVGEAVSSTTTSLFVLLAVGGFPSAIAAGQQSFAIRSNFAVKSWTLKATLALVWLCSIRLSFYVVTKVWIDPNLSAGKIDHIRAAELFPSLVAIFLSFLASFGSVLSAGWIIARGTNRRRSMA